MDHGEVLEVERENVGKKTMERDSWSSLYTIKMERLG